MLASEDNVQCKFLDQSYPAGENLQIISLLFLLRSIFESRHDSQLCKDDSEASMEILILRRERFEDNEIWRCSVI